MFHRWRVVRRRRRSVQWSNRCRPRTRRRRWSRSSWTRASGWRRHTAIYRLMSIARDCIKIWDICKFLSQHVFWLKKINWFKMLIFASIFEVPIHWNASLDFRVNFCWIERKQSYCFGVKTLNTVYPHQKISCSAVSDALGCSSAAGSVENEEVVLRVHRLRLAFYILKVCWV